MFFGVRQGHPKIVQEAVSNTIVHHELLLKMLYCAFFKSEMCYTVCNTLYIGNKVEQFSYVWKFMKFIIQYLHVHVWSLFSLLLPSLEDIIISIG